MVAPERRAPRVHGLDIVRAAAIAWVMIYHAMNLDLVPEPDHTLILFGWMGVDLFFVLSGFLIASQLLKPWAKGARPDYRRFFARRALRTLPAFVAVLALYFLLPAAREWPDIQPFWQFATFTENLLFEPTGAKAFSHVWSLCVEEQFYLVFPAAVALLALRPSAGKTVSVIAALVLLGVTLRSWLWLRDVATIPFDPTSPPQWRPYMTLIYYPTWSRLDGLLAGIAIASLKIFRPSQWERIVERPNLLLALGLAGIAGSMLLFGSQIAGLGGAALGFPLLSVGIALIVAAASTDRALIGRYRFPGAAALATGAYSLYLTQKLAYHAVATWLAPLLGATGYARLALALAAALAASAVLYWAVERPFLRLRDRLEGPSRSPIARGANIISEEAALNDPEPTAAERKEAAAIRRRWINIGEILAVIGVVISALALWNGYSERKSNEEERAAEKAKQSTVSRLLILKAHGEGRRLDLSPHNGEQAIQGQTILFPATLGVGAIDTTEARIEAEWVKQAVKSADEKAKAPGDARMPIAITTRFVSGGTAVTDAALYDVGYKRSGGGLFGGTNIELRGLALIGRVKPAEAQARVDALWLARHPDT